MLSEPWRYDQAVIVGVLAGGVLFLLLALFGGVPDTSQVEVAVLTVVGSAAIACLGALTRNLLSRRDFDRHNEQRRLWLTKDE